MRLLIAEDNRELANTLQMMLKHQKYLVDVVHDGQEALEYAGQSQYDGIILDVMMPKLDGFQVLELLRSRGNHTPVLFLTARCALQDRVQGLDLGADDYLTKPFSQVELLSRVRAMLRRSSSYTPELLAYGNLRLDRTAFELSTPHGRVPLSTKEYQLMELFLREPRRVFSIDLLMETVWGWDSDTSSSVVWTYVGMLRKKLTELQADVQIRSQRGVGYCVTQNPPEPAADT